MTSPNFRAFIAIELPEHVRNALARLLEELRRRDRERVVRWVRPEAIHLTLQFLGETPVAGVEAIRKEMTAAAGAHRSFALRLGKLGWFPNSIGGLSARVLWVGLDGELEALARLQREVAAGLEGLGYQPERRDFSPHLTLGRIPGGRFNAAGLFQEVPWPPPAPPGFLAEGISLMESTLLPQGARYTQRLFLPLGKP